MRMIFQDQKLSLEVAESAKKIAKIQNRRYVYIMHFIPDISE